MSDIVERLHIIRNHLSTGALGQREAWEEWLTRAAAEIERLDEENQWFRNVMADILTNPAFDRLLAGRPKP